MFSIRNTFWKKEKEEERPEEVWKFSSIMRVCSSQANAMWSWRSYESVTANPVQCFRPNLFFITGFTLLHSPRPRRNLVSCCSLIHLCHMWMSSKLGAQSSDMTGNLRFDQFLLVLLRGPWRVFSYFHYNMYLWGLPISFIARTQEYVNFLRGRIVNLTF